MLCLGEKGKGDTFMFRATCSCDAQRILGFGDEPGVVPGQQLLWIQATDQPPHDYFSEYSAEDLRILKTKWLDPTYHAKKTDGILSLFPWVHDLPCKITNGRGSRCKEFGLHNGARCWLRALSLNSSDLERVRQSDGAELVLGQLPDAIWIESEMDLKKQVPGVPKNWFPLTPMTNMWSLDKDENIEITRRGYALVPDFASTIHSATGRTLTSAIGDFGNFDEKPSYAAAMRGYIGMSRVQNADGLLISRPFPWKLFMQGVQPFPDLLLKTLKEDATMNELFAECSLIDKALQDLRKSSSPLWLRNVVNIECQKCGVQKAIM